MRKYNNANFSFAGLKTSVRMAIDAHVNNAQPSHEPGEPLVVPAPSPSDGGASSPPAPPALNATLQSIASGGNVSATSSSSNNNSSSSNSGSSSQSAQPTAHSHTGEHASTSAMLSVGQSPQQQHIDLTQQLPDARSQQKDAQSQQGDDSGVEGADRPSTSGRDPLRQVRWSTNWSTNCRVTWRRIFIGLVLLRKDSHCPVSRLCVTPRGREAVPSLLSDIPELQLRSGCKKRGACPS